MKEFPTISNIYLITTHRCNLACRYCFVHQDPHDMPLKVGLDAIDWLVANNPEGTQHQVFFFGGEPLLRFHDLMEPVVLYAERKYPNRKISFSMTTNSVLMDDEVLQFIHDHNIGVLTSIDGNKECQGYNRPFHDGSSSADIVEEHVKKYIESGKVSTFRSTILPATCHLMFDNYLYAKSLGYRSMFGLTNAYEVWPADKRKEVYDQMKKIADHYIDYFREHNEVFLGWSNIERHFREVYNDIKLEERGEERPNMFTDQKCGYGQNSNAAVAVNGDLYGCQELVSNEGKKNTFWIGNIYTGVENERRQALYDLFYSFPKTGDMACADCPARSICNGGCSATNYVLTGDLNHCPPGHCFYFRHSYSIARYIVESLMDNQAFFNQFLANGNNQRNRCNGCQICQGENSNTNGNRNNNQMNRNNNNNNNGSQQQWRNNNNANGNNNQQRNNNANTNSRLTPTTNKEISTVINNGPVQTAPTPLKDVNPINANSLTSASAIHGWNNSKKTCDGSCGDKTKCNGSCH